MPPFVTDSRLMRFVVSMIKAGRYRRLMMMNNDWWLYRYSGLTAPDSRSWQSEEPCLILQDLEHWSGCCWARHNVLLSFFTVTQSRRLELQCRLIYNATYYKTKTPVFGTMKYLVNGIRRAGVQNGNEQATVNLTPASNPRTSCCRCTCALSTQVSRRSRVLTSGHVCALPLN